MKVKNQKLKIKSKGFTLIELMVSIFIMVTLSSIMVANYREGEKSRRVSLAADGIINAVRLAQNYTLSGKQIDQTTCPNKSAVSYRVNFTASSEYAIYAEDSCSNPLFEIQRFSLPQQTQMKAGELKLNENPQDSLSIKFLTPFAQMQAAGDDGVFVQFTAAYVGVEFQDQSKNKSVIIDGVSGRIGE